eukprot:6448173-Amphidinium_carterae.1
MPAARSHQHSRLHQGELYETGGILQTNSSPPPFGTLGLAPQDHTRTIHRSEELETAPRPTPKAYAFSRH